MLYADYETLRALDSDNSPTVPSMSEEEINALPVHKYKVAGSQRLVIKFCILEYLFQILKTDLCASSAK